jgi:hypothetical protein
MIRPQHSLSAALALITLAACASDETNAPAPPSAVHQELAVTSNAWTAGAPMPFEVANFGVAALNNSVDQPASTWWVVPTRPVP